MTTPSQASSNRSQTAGPDSSSRSRLEQLRDERGPKLGEPIERSSSSPKPISECRRYSQKPGLDVCKAPGDTPPIDGCNCPRCIEVRHQRAVREAYWRDASMPPRHAETPPGKLFGTEWQRRLADLTSRLGSGFLIALIGPRGTGKTQKAAETIRCATLDRGLPSLYCKIGEFFLELRATYSSQTSTERSVIERHLHPHLLVLDEIGVRAETTFEDTMFTLLIDRRYDAMKDTILISNQTREGLLGSVGKSIESRLLESGGIIMCDWASFRGRPPGAFGD